MFEEPTNIQRNGTRVAQMRAYVNELAKSPDRWAIYARNAKSANYFYQIAKEFPNLRIATRMNADRKTMRVYFMWESKPTSKRKATTSIKSVKPKQNKTISKTRTANKVR